MRVGLQIRFRLGFFLGLGLVVATPAAAIDLSGVYVSHDTFFQEPCTLTFAQSGTALTVAGPCVTLDTVFTFDLAGTVDPMTGAFAVSGVLFNLCETPGSVTMIGTGDGEVFTAVASCGSASLMYEGTKCGNGTIDATEDCEDGNTAPGDCCSPICRFDAPGTACPADLNSCTADGCDGAGHCQHLALGSGAPCPSDGNDCTDDVCNASAQCTHVAISGPCDDANACTTADACAAGTCVGGPIAPECVGPFDLTGDWEVTSTPSFGESFVHHFEQTDAVLRSSGDGIGIGSVNPATGMFVAYTPFTYLGIAECVEQITATASADGLSFAGTVVTNCGLDGTFGPYSVTGRRCTPADPCVTGVSACDTEVPCTSPDRGARLTIRMRHGELTVRWRWSHSATPTDFADPTADADYRLCLDTPAEGFLEGAPHGSAWRSNRWGFRYADSSGPIRRLLLKDAPKKTMLGALVVPQGALTLPLATPVRVRLIRTQPSGMCFASEFASPNANTATRFRATQ